MASSTAASGNADVEMAEKQHDKFVDTVGRIVLRVNMVEGHEGSPEKKNAPSEGQGPLTSQELSELSLLCTLQTTFSKEKDSSTPLGFANVEGDQLANLIELLDKHVNLAVGVQIIRDALEVMKKEESPSKASISLNKWLQAGEGSNKITSLRLGLEAASIIIFIAVCPEVDRRAINEDAIEAAITLYRLHLSKNIVPALNLTGHLMATVQQDQKAVNTSPSKKRRRSDGPTGAAKELKKVYKLIHATVGLQLVLMDRMEQLVNDLPLDDQQILMLTNGSLTSLEVDCAATPPSKDIPPAQQLQLASVAVITAAFRKYPMHRDTILEDLFPVMLRLPTGKKSLRAFPLRYTSAPSPTNLASLNSSLYASLLSNGKEPHYIQMMTAMILSMIQACVVCPTYEEPGDDDDDDEPPRLASGLGQCQAICDFFVVQLLKRCARTKGGASEFRPILSNLVEDLLLALLIPEYPAAEMIVFSLSRHLNQDLTKASPSLFKGPSKMPPTEITYLNLAFDVLGKICAVEARILAAHREKPIKITDDVVMSDDGDMHIGCHCAKSHVNVFMINCDQCKIFYHGSCVGINSEEVPEEWMCDGCRLGRISERERRKHDMDGQDSFIDGAYAMRHSFLSNLSHRMGVSEIEDPTKFHLARWADELEHRAKTSGEAQGPTRKLVSELLVHWGAQRPSGEPLTEEGGTRVILALVAESSPLLSTFRNQVGFILKLMSDDSTPSLRKLSVKTIEKVVEGDPNLMLMPVVTKAVSRRLTDDSISVREAAVSLVGSYVVQFPPVASAFHSSLLSCLSDVGVSVRKRAVRIFQAILTSNPRYKNRSTVCDKLIQCAVDPKEEDGVRDLIFDLFSKLWLQDGEGIVPGPKTLAPKKENAPPSTDPADDSSQDVIVGPTNPGVVTPTPEAPSRKSKQSHLPQKRADFAAEQMMEVVRAGGTGEYLEALLKKLLGEVPDADKGRKKSERKKQAELGRKQCDQLANSLLELLVSIEEQRSTRASRIGKDLAATLQTIGVFAEVSPASVFRHLDTVLPYLKADNGVSFDDESAIVGAVCDIIYRLSPILDEQDIERLASGCVARDIIQITYKFGPDVLDSAVRALSALAYHSEASMTSIFGKKYLELARTFYSYLCKKEDVEDFSAVDEKIRSNTHRALTVLGLICEHHKSPNGLSMPDSEMDTDDEGNVEPKDLTWTNMITACYSLFSTYLQKKDAPTKCSALRALGGIFVSLPRLMLELEQIGLIDDVMSDSSPVTLQLESLQCWRSILEAEEKRIDGGRAQAKLDSDEKITVSKRIEGDQDGDATLFGGVLTNHADRLFEMTHAQDRRVRFAALDLIGLLLRQGLINPNEAVPFLFALQGDVDNNAIRSMALRLLMKEGEKRPDSLRQRACVGVKQAYEFQRAVYPEKTEASALVFTKRGRTVETEFECIFGSVFKECIADSRKQRHGLFKNLLTLFDLNDRKQLQSPRKQRKNGRTDPGSTDLALLSFASQILAHLPYSTAEDPLFIIHHIGSVVTLQGSQILDRFAALLRPVGLSSSDEYDETNASADALERAARTKFPSRTQEARALGSDKFDMAGFLDSCRQAAALVLLLRLKSFLRRLYNLSETRCLEYDPGSKERLSDKGTAKAKISKPFDSSIPLGLHGSTKGVDKNAIIRQYAEFRRLMRDENSAEQMTNRSDEDKASPEDAPSRKRAADVR